MSHVIVIGGGPAGMMAAIAAARSGHQVMMLEKNEKLGKKLFITGKGRCNLTNGCETEELFRNVVTNPKFLYSAFYQFDNQQTIAFFENAGCKVKEERGGRIFPVSDHSSDVIAALNRAMQKHHIEIRLHSEAARLEVNEEAAGKRIAGIRLKNGTALPAEAVVLATGGASYPLTGSTGAGYVMAREVGHTIIPAVPSLVPLVIKEDWCRQLQGLSLKNVTAGLYAGNKTIFEGFGEMLFTHFGVSGPLILTGSSHYVKKYNHQPVTLKLDLKPALSAEQLDKRILRDFEESKNKQFKNSLDKLLPAKLIPIIIKLSGIEEQKQVNEITREERKGLLELLKGLTMTVTGTRDIKEAIITQGGICVKEVNASTMESKLVKGLYFAGEVLDVDALTGGYNLQIAWSSGYLAGSSIDETGKADG